MEIPAMPKNDILTAIDNDQVLLKKWTVRKDNHSQMSILTSGKWCNRLAGAKVNSPERQRLIDDYSATADDVLILQKKGNHEGLY
ncbi:unnamed protein product [Porites lobata]|uniref:Uncharacterized protein n=1 Tax=Porites lobata TaxID=104759 RepID=A0ABN8PR62_9CNID|nr:unnamed protein product [Porites lobata]